MEKKGSNVSPIKLAISSCLLGEKVRYDGTDKRLDILANIPRYLVTFIPVCPEVAIGMGIPRPPIHLVETGNDIQALQIDDPARNFTEPLQVYGRKMVNELEGICGYIFKARSPSCGVNSAPVFKDGAELRKDTGLFARQIIRKLPDLPVTEEADLDTTEDIQHFLDKTLDYCGQQNIMPDDAIGYLAIQIKQYLQAYAAD